MYIKVHVTKCDSPGLPTVLLGVYWDHTVIPTPPPTRKYFRSRNTISAVYAHTGLPIWPFQMFICIPFKLLRRYIIIVPRLGIPPCTVTYNELHLLS